MTQLFAQGPTRNEQVDVTTTSSMVADAKFLGQERVMIILRNTSPNAADIITLNYGNVKAEDKKGIVLRQNDFIIDSNSEGYKCWQGPIQAVCATIDGKLSIMSR